MLRTLTPLLICLLLAAPALGEEPTDAPPADAPPADAPPADDDSAPPPPPPPASEVTPPAPTVDLERGTGTLYADGYERFSRGDFPIAALLFEEVLRREPRHPSARNYLVECYSAQGREEDATRVRDGEPPRGEATAPAAPKATATVREDSETKEQAEARRSGFNPRRNGMGGVGLGLLGPTVGVGIWAEFRPLWLVSISGGIGGVAIKRDSGVRTGIGAVFGEVALLPVPFRLTPMLGVGFTVLSGPAAWQVDGYARALAGRGNARGVLYVLLGVRYDSARGFFASGGVGLIPTGRAPGAFTPWPGFRFGARF